ncbi:MAG TPA: UPF0149 family protein [Ramlibacter sp.]|jgi:uncharacterized protein|uniref:UPF0149 family protein n=1 Tax=Ramlibacter sp. TaxID=1917967 RepID=UPI002D2C4C26|nr:UPF0149 family protein [Ramlibacter sp.]HZY17234.1 UPF0149 family protein [Ramlibacter sp.]
MTTDTPDPAPLGPDDFDALDAELDALREHDELTPDWEFCEGFLAALVCTRRVIEPEEYWPVLFGEGFRPMEHMEFVWRWRRRWQEIAQALDAQVETLEDERAYQPEVLDVRGAVLALSEAERGDADVAQLPSFGEAWAEGFLHVVGHWADEWAAPRDKEAAEMLDDALDVIGHLAEPDTGVPALNLHTEDGPPSVSDARLNDFGEAVWAVYDLRQFWKSLGPRVQQVRKAAEPGRNDPCPCGSGKKYKKCHGA